MILPVVILILAGQVHAPSLSAEQCEQLAAVRPWLEALASYDGYQALLSQAGPEATIKVIRLIETSFHPEMIRAIIEVESAWNVHARSSRDARGLMQIRSIAARDLDPGIDPDELFDPVVSVRLGIRIFEQHMDYFFGYDNTEHWALTAYNRGRSATFALNMTPPRTRYSRRVMKLTENA